MNRVLTVPNFSTPIPPDTVPVQGNVKLHYNKGDLDHGRTVIALSGEPRWVSVTLTILAWTYLREIDLRVSSGEHPRIGALDVAPFIDLEGSAAYETAEAFAFLLWDSMGIATLPYERNAREGATSNLSELRRRPPSGHPQYGTTVYGARDFLIAANLNFPGPAREAVHRAAREIRRRRDSGEPALAGVRALAFDLASRGEVQLSFNLTRPDETAFDAVAAIGEALVGRRASGTELVGVIRPRDLPGATRLRVAPEQIVA